MKLADAREAYYGHSGKASDVARSLCLAGIAVVWIFRQGTNPPVPPTPLVAPLALFAAALACDLVHYVVAGLIWGTYARYKEIKVRDKEDDFEAPPYLNYPAIFLWGVKVVLTCIGYGLLVFFLGDQWGIL